MAETKSPLKDKPLRNPGQSVRKQRIEILVNQLLLPLVVAAIAITLAFTEWWRYLFPIKNAPWLQTTLALLTLGYFGIQMHRYWPRVLALELAEEGEKAVGQHLEGLRSQGYAVFHDLVGDDFNVDHVIIGPAGVFTIETKTWRKPAKGSPKITFDGETLLAAGCEPERNPVIQAKAQASWLRRLLAESTGKDYPVRPVVLFPGWFIEDGRPNRRDVWVLEPKMLPGFLANEKTQLPPDDVSLASSHLSRFIRAEERRLETAS